MSLVHPLVIAVTLPLLTYSSSLILKSFFHMMTLLCNTPDTNILSLLRNSVITCAENMCLYLFLSRMEIS